MTSFINAMSSLLDLYYLDSYIRNYRITFILVTIIIAFVCSYIAYSKNRNAITWFILGGLFGIFAIIAIACVSKVEDLEDIYEYRKCPYCAETIKREAIICRFCGKKLPKIEETEEIEFSGNPEEVVCWKCGTRYNINLEHCPKCYEKNTLEDIGN